MPEGKIKYLGCFLELEDKKIIKSEGVFLRVTQESKALILNRFKLKLVMFYYGFDSVDQAQMLQSK